MQKPVVTVMVKAARLAGNVLLRNINKLEALNVVQKGRMDYASEVDADAEKVRSELGNPETLILGVDTDDRGGQLTQHTLDRLRHTLAQVALATVAQLVSLVHTGRSTGRNAGNTAGAVIKEDLGLDGWVTTGIKNFAGESVDDVSHAVFHSS